MALELEGTLVRKLDVQSGTSARGTWEKREFIVEYQEGNYPSQAVFNVWGADKVKELERIPSGTKVKVSFNISSREFNNRWYTDLRAWKIDILSPEYAAAPSPASTSAYVQQAAPAQPQMAPAPVTEDVFVGDSDEDLPF